MIFKRKIRTVSFCLLLGATTAGLSACREPAPQATAGAQRHEVKGKIVSADKANHKVTIEHEEIPGYMDAMTMSFTLLDDWVYPELTPGAQIQATLVVDAGRTWLENPVITKIVDPALAARSEETGVEPAAGAEPPAFPLVNQDGKKINLHQYRGRILLLTFLYTRCPLPDYCPLMTQHFATLQREARKNPALGDQLHLLAVSVDPAYDQPNVLREYGARYTDSFARWEFATGTAEEVKAIAQFFGLNYWPEKDQIIHGLRTALIGPDGKVVRVYRGNEWKPEQVLKDLKSLVR
jgi:protein SCO1